MIGATSLLKVTPVVFSVAVPVCAERKNAEARKPTKKPKLRIRFIDDPSLSQSQCDNITFHPLSKPITGCRAGRRADHNRNSHRVHHPRLSALHHPERRLSPSCRLLRHTSFLPYRSPK